MKDLFKYQYLRTYYVLKAKLPQHKIMFRIRKHPFHFQRGESRPIGIDKIRHDYSVARSPERNTTFIIELKLTFKI